MENGQKSGNTDKDEELPGVDFQKDVHQTKTNRTHTRVGDLVCGPRKTKTIFFSFFTKWVVVVVVWERRKEIIPRAHAHTHDWDIYINTYTIHI